MEESPKETEAFLMEWKDSAPADIQYATEKMTREESQVQKAKEAPRIPSCATVHAAISELGMTRLCSSRDPDRPPA